MRRDVSAIGIDVKPADDLPLDVIDFIATPRERVRISDIPFGERLLFVAKEANYRAVHPLTIRSS